MFYGVGIPGSGQNKVLKNYWTSVELFGETMVKDWGKVQRVCLDLSCFD